MDEVDWDDLERMYWEALRGDVEFGNLSDWPNSTLAHGAIMTNPKYQAYGAHARWDVQLAEICARKGVFREGYWK